ncbi:hypothetical protein YTPLAS21_19560 [Candidatus Nitrosocosmicus sp.]|nr:hypothetical protein YTPLAS21_19560 [Candidatus Nitrosocosmicus sp.]
MTNTVDFKDLLHTRMQTLAQDLDKSAAEHNKLLGKLEETRTLLENVYKKECDAKEALEITDCAATMDSTTLEAQKAAS